MYGRLDYPAEALAPFGRDRLVMEANTDIERMMRLVACAKEPWTVAFIEGLQPGEVFWDVGANVGPYTLIAAARGLEVVAFEPVGENYATLCRNLALNNMLSSVLALPLALADQDALIWQHRSDMRSGAASHELSASATKRTMHQQLIPLLTATTAWNLWQLPIPHAVKIDVDGFELQVLAGAEWILAHEQVRALLLELNVRADAVILEWLKAHGWEQTERYPERGGIYYATFGRPVAAGARPRSNGVVRRRAAKGA